MVITNYINRGKDSIDAATSIDQVKQELEKYKKLIDAVPTKDIIYYCSSGNGSKWRKGSNVDSNEFVFKRMVNDEEYTHSKFSSLSIDGKTIDKSLYTYKKGSLKIVLKKSILETLSISDHTITVEFEEGAKTSAKFTVEKPSTAPKTNTSIQNITNVTVPNTGAD